jgi:hypothetical protein
MIDPPTLPTLLAHPPVTLRLNAQTIYMILRWGALAEQEFDVMSDPDDYRVFRALGKAYERSQL